MGASGTWLGPGLVGSPGTQAMVMPCALTDSKPAGISATVGAVHGSTVCCVLASNAGATIRAGPRGITGLPGSIGGGRDRVVVVAEVSVVAAAGGSTARCAGHSQIAMPITASPTSTSQRREVTRRA